MTKPSVLLASLPLVSGLALVACGGQSFDGAVKGQTLAVKEAIYQTHDAGALGSFGVVLMSDRTGLCDQFKKNKFVAGQRIFLMEIVSTDSTGHGLPVTAGAYPTFAQEDEAPNGTRASFGLFSTLDSSCHAVENAVYTTSGSVKVDKFESSGGANGSFDVAFEDDGGTAKGNFAASFCDQPIQYGLSTGSDCE